MFITTKSLLEIDVNVTIAGLDFKTTTNVTRYQYASIALPQSVLLTSTGKQNKTVRVTSSGVVSVHCIDSDDGAGDGFLVLPTNQLGKQHYVVTYKPFDISYPALVCVSALDMKTSIVIRNQTSLIQQVTLNPYESYRFGSPYEDLTGTLVESTEPISVISGLRASIPIDSSTADGLVEQVMPTELWGHRFVIGPFLGRSSGFIYRVLAGNNNSTLQISNRGALQIQAGDWFEDDVSGDTVVSVVAENPVLVVQYMKSQGAEDKYDPAMIIVPSVESFVNNVTFPVIETTYTASIIHYNIHVTINCTFTDDLKFDEATSMSTWEKLPSTDGEMCIIRGNVTIGVHSVTHHDPAAKFTVAVYGLYSSAAAYAYPAGFQPYSRKIFIFI